MTTRTHSYKRIVLLTLALAAIALLLSGCGNRIGAARAGDAVEETYQGPAPSFSEVVPNNASCFAAKDGSYYPWVELVNNQDSPVQLREHYLSNDLSNPTLWQFPSVVLEPGQRMVLFLSGLFGTEGELHAGFSLNEEDTSLYLYSMDGKQQDRISWNTPAACNLAFIKTGATTACTAFPTPWEENDTRTLPSQATIIHASESTESSDPIVLNELLRENQDSILDSDGEHHPWVELYNRSSQPVSLLGYALSDDIEQPARWLLPDITLQPDSYLVVFLSGKNRHGAELHTSFRLTAQDSALVLADLDTGRTDFLPIVQEVAPIFVIGRTEDGSFRIFAGASPNAANTGLTFDAYRQAYPRGE